MRRSHFAAALLLAVVGCGDDSTVEPPPPPAPGAIRTIVATEGVDQPIGYGVDVDTLVSLDVAPNDTALVSVVPGEYSVSLRDIPSNCLVEVGGNPRDATVASADTTSLFFGVECAPDMSRRIVYQGYTENFGWDIYSLPSDGGDLFRHTHFPAGNPSPISPVLSPDRTILAYTVGPTIYLSDVASESASPLVAGTISEFSADGEHILYTNEGDIWSADIDGTNVTRITESLDRKNYPTWSPDRSRIAYAATNDQVCITPDEAGVNCVTEASFEAAYWPDWSPDGSRIVFSGVYSGPEYLDNGWRIYSMRLDGTDILRLTGNGRYQDILADWSPDGSQIAFTRCWHGEICDIFVMDADGSNLTNITEDRARDQTNPNW